VRDFAPPGTRLLLASSFVATVPMGYLLVVLPLYLDRAGIQPAFIGLLYTVSGLVSSLIVAFSGVFADRWAAGVFSSRARSCRSRATWCSPRRPIPYGSSRRACSVGSASRTAPPAR
jgi:MFS family permease